MGALIRQAFGVDPYALSVSEFARYGQEALFINELKKQTIEQALDDRLELAVTRAMSVIMAR